MSLGRRIYLTIFIIFVGIALVMQLVQDNILSKSYTMTVLKTGDDIFISYRYQKNTDMHLVIGKCGVNNLVDIKAIYLDTNYTGEIYPWVTKRATNFLLSCTDWIGPYMVKAIEHDDGGKPTFTGGWHGNTVDGKEEPTAHTENYSVKIGDTELLDDKVYYCDNVQIEVTNFIQAYNTKDIKLNVLKENVRYDIAPNKVNVEVISTTLEKVLLQKYYGLQAQNGAFERIEYSNGIAANCREYSDSGPFNKNNIANSFKLISKDDKYKMIVTLDTDFGLGNFEKLSLENPTIFTQSYGKTYFNLVNGADKLIEKGDSIKWRGSYEFK
jgi:hypothetical protein